jgi:Tfp pilus assembly protein PilF
MQLARGDRDQAEAAFLRAVEMAPDAIDARLGLANFYWATGRGPEAASSITGLYVLMNE